ncbi:MAG TPA: alpha/beta hydrolase fold domain-containing protein [Phycisphaerales bacterium]|nr:alpha/beta hydrolase fold domain-containing protein [Phycisphaerales bacterium]
MSSSRGFLCGVVVVAVICVIACLTETASAQTPPTYSNLVYATPGPRHELDLYIPNEPCSEWPLVIFLYGGGWLVGDKLDVEEYVDPLLSRGFAVASVNYRYSYQAIFPAQIHDVKGAIRWLRAHAATYHLDPDRFAIFGESAGAHLAGLVGTSGGIAALEGDIGGNLTQSSGVQAVGDFAGPTDLITLVTDPPHSNTVANLFGYANWWEMPMSDPTLLALMQSADPATHATANDPPFWIVHGIIDDLVPVIQAQHLHNALLAAGAPTNLTLLPGVGHGIPDPQYYVVFDHFAELLVTPPQPGDINCDGVVNVQDLLTVIAVWGPCVKGTPCPDTNDDGVVDVNDMLQVIAHWS